MLKKKKDSLAPKIPKKRVVNRMTVSNTQSSCVNFKNSYGIMMNDYNSNKGIKAK